MSRFVLPSMDCLAVPYFPHYLTNGAVFGEGGNWTYKTFVLIFSTVWSEIILILRRTVRDVIIHVQYRCTDFHESTRHCVRFKWNGLSRRIFGNYSKIRFRNNLSRVKSVVPCRRTDRLSKLVMASRNFAWSDRYWFVRVESTRINQSRSDHVGWE